MFVICDKKDIEKLKICSGKRLTMYQPDLLDTNYVLVHILELHKDKDIRVFIKNLMRENVPVYILSNILSIKSIERLKDVKGKNPLSAVSDDTLLDKLLLGAEFKESEKRYCISSEYNATQYNLILKWKDLLLKKKMFIMGLSSIFSKSIQDILKEELEDEIVSIVEVDKINNEFFMLVIAQFMIYAGLFYSQEEIGQYLLKTTMKKRR